jgi:undecaprenyl phosphate-alpha-L-ara4FN deformylase
VDVDTRRGLETGVPRLLELFRRVDIRASFFVTMGPDRSGLALRRAWRPSFILKMWRTNPFRLYGVRTLFAGTLLPAEPVGSSAPALLRQTAGEGHEVAPHGFDHVGWQDTIHRMTDADVHADLGAAARAYETVFCVAPGASAAPGWRMSARALAVQEAFGYAYASDVRGTAPFRPWVGGRALRTLQVPTTMPTLDELIGRTRDIPGALVESLRPGLNVFTLHAEVEGGPFLGAFTEFIDRARRRGATMIRLVEAVMATRADEPLPAAEVGRGSIPGRSGWITIQGRRVS